MSSFNFGKELSKGQKFNFGKSDDLSKIRIDLTWEGDADLDVCAFLVGDDGILTNKEDFVFYNSDMRWRPVSEDNVTEGKIELFDIATHRTKKAWKSMTVPVSADTSVIGSPDVAGDDDGGKNCETMHVVLDRVGVKIRAIIFGAAIYTGSGDENVTFGSVKNPAILVTNEETGESLCHFNIKDNFADETALEAGRILLNDEGEWEFEPMGTGYTGGMPTLADIYA